MTLWNPESNAPLSYQFEEASGDPGTDLERGVQLLREVQSGAQGALLRFYRPDPTLAFGQRDIRLPGFERAAQAAQSAGFAPLVRKAGGRAAAYHRGTLIVDHIEPHSEAIIGQQQRFKVFADLYASAFRKLHVDAQVGPIPGEYCPGDYSAHGVPTAQSNITNAVKLIGTAQRVISGAWLFSSVFVIEDSSPLRSVLDAVYRAMEIPMDPSTVGAADDLVSGVTVDSFVQALLSVYQEHTQLLGV